jgi:Tol biopolymer transport system component
VVTGSSHRNVKTLLTGKDEEAGWPVWSPDGREILYWAFKDGNQNVWVMDTDGRNKRRLTDHPTLDGEGDETEKLQEFKKNNWIDNGQICPQTKATPSS